MRTSLFKHRPVAFLPVFALLVVLIGLAVPVVAQDLTPEMLEEASRRTGLSKEELIRQYEAEKGGTATAGDVADPANQPGRTTLEGVDDSGAQAGFKDTAETVMLPFGATLEMEMQDALQEALATETVLGDSVGYFGTDFFKLEDGVFVPPSFGPVPEDYRLGVGDEIIINVWGGVAFRETRIVDRDGSIILPRAGKIICAGRTLGQVDKTIRVILAQSHASIDADGSGPGEGDTHLEVTLGKLRSIRVYVVGAVNRPGSYELSSVSRVLTALYAAGGPTISGSLRDIRLVRGADTVSHIDLYGYLLGGSRAGDAQLQEGDTVYIPDVGPSVRVRGEIKRPMWYEMKSGETLSDLLDYSGGFTAEASTDVVHIQRILPPGLRKPGEPDHVFLDVTFDAESMKAKGQPVLLLDGDIVQIDAIKERVENFVEIIGNVKQPGQYQYTEGLTATALVAMAGGLWPDALLERAVVDRTSHAGDLSSFTFPLGLVISGDVDDVVLQAMDQVHVFARWENLERPQVFINGEVYKPFNEDFREGMTLRDLILKAGGFKRNADMMRAEVARLKTDDLRSRDLEMRPIQTVEIIEVALNGDFLTKKDSLLLQAWDRVSIRSLPWWENQNTVQVRGEVFYPGTFSLERKDERLSSLITRAGGLKPDAYLVGARVERIEDGVGNIALDLMKAITEPGGEYDIFLKQGDVIIIPDRMFTVKVVGEVGFPTSLVHVEGLDINDYVDMAGGYLEKADKDKSRVIWPNGMSLPNKGGSEVVAGSRGRILGKQ